MKNRWTFFEYSNDAVASLASELNLSPLLAQLLIARGQVKPDSAWRFLNPSLEDLHDPFLMRDMGRAVDRILQARDRHEKVLIYGDYDVDGMTSTVILKRALEMIGLEVDFHLPRRLEEGYGLRKEVISAAQQDGFSLVITADNGVRALDVCEHARELGLDLIVTDHHLPGEKLPRAYAVVNPRREDCSYPDKDLAAVGVVFKLVQALFNRVGRENVVPHFLKLVAIGTIADVVPLVGENRIFTKFGLEGLSDPRNVGLKVLLQGAGVEDVVSNFDVSFKVAPRMNAVTRMGGGREVIDLFATSNETLAETIVQEMNQKNVRRREEEDRILEEIEQRIEASPDAFEKPFLLVSGQGWHRGVIGIVASRLVERFYRPVLVLSQDGRVSQGSGRSIPGFHLLKALDSCQGFFSRYGGHAQAVGCTLEEGASQGALEDLENRLVAYARSHLSEENLVPALPIDVQLPLEKVDFGLFDELQRLAPFGIGNPVPTLASTEVQVASGPWLLKEKHLKFRVRANGLPLDAIWWKHGEFADRIGPGDRLDIAYSLDRNVYMGEEKLLLTVSDLRLG